MLARRLFSALLFPHRSICSSRILQAQHTHKEEEEAEEEEEEERNHSWRRKDSYLLQGTIHEEGGERGGGEEEEEEEESDSSSFTVPKVLRAYLRSRRSRCVSRVREQGRVPAVLVNDDSNDHGSTGRSSRNESSNVFLSLDAEPVAAILKFLGKRDFISRVFNMNIYRHPESEEIKESLQVLPRNLNYGEGKTNILNIQFIRANPDRTLKLGVPLEYIGLDTCPGLEKGGTLKRLAKYVVYNCKATEVPPKLVVDMTVLEIGDQVLVQDLEVDYELLHSERTMPVCEIIKDVEITAKSKRLKNEIFHKRQAICGKDDALKTRVHVESQTSDYETDVDEANEGPYPGRIRRSAIAKGKVKPNDHVDVNAVDEPQSNNKKPKPTYRRKRAPESRKLADDGVSSVANTSKKGKPSKRRLLGSSLTSRKPVQPKKLEEKNN